VLPTFVIGLREGLEAVLIVSIVATFLRRNGVSLRPMWLGVGVAVLLSIAVGVVLEVVEQNLPQAKQEGMETIIGLVAVFFVTGMVVWMRQHARTLKRDLEESAALAIGSGTAWALVGMAFLAVLREGFETSVFLLATAEAASSGWAALAGALLGILAAIAIGYGIFTGGVRINLARFFTITGVFLVFVAAGLVLAALRTAHEAGWVTFGQNTTVDLGWLAPTGSVRAALVTGVFGMPADPRVVELLGWACYLVPVLALVLWPKAWAVPAAWVPRLRLAGAGVLVVLALALVLTVDVPRASAPASAPITDGGTATISVSADGATLTAQRDTGDLSTDLARTESDGGDVRWHADLDRDRSDLPTRLTVEELLTYTGQRIPVGLDVHRTPGPYDAAWSESGSATATTYDGGLVDARQDAKLVLTLSGGGLTSPRVMQVDEPTGSLAWQVDPAAATATSTAIAEAESEAREAALWHTWFPILLVIVAAALVAATARDRLRPTAPPPQSAAPHSERPTHART
jgi:high-affinity iron transporter